MRHATRIGFGNSDGGSQGLRLGCVFVVLDDRCGMGHAERITHPGRGG